MYTRHLVLLLASLLVLGCDERAEPVAPAHGVNGTAAGISGAASAAAGTLDVLQAARDTKSTDAFFARIHEAVPGFAGLTFEDGIPTIYLVDSGRTELAKSVLSPFFATKGKVGRGIRIREAQFPWGDLYNWRLKARGLFDLPELRSLRISTSHNRIIIGLAIGASSAGAVERLTRLDIDLGAVEFREEPETELFSNLDDRLRPVMGGYIVDKAGTDGECTVGANVQWGSSRTFLTAFHCFSTTVYQPTYGGGNKIGDVLLTPSSFTCTPKGEGSPVNNCRNSDAALIEYDDSVSWSFGHIARPTYAGQWSGSTAISGRFWITDSYVTVVQGDTLHKVGYRTGWTVGEVSDPAVDRQSGGYWYIDQVMVRAGADGGDSGSPVFEMGTYGRVSLAGVLWGGWPDSVYFYSPLKNIEDDFGAYIDVITDSPSLPSGVSISGPTSIRPGATCLWEGSVSSGTTPFSYIWENDSHGVSYTTSYTGGKLSGSSGSSFVLKFTVSNDAGGSSDQITVTEDSNAPICVY